MKAIELGKISLSEGEKIKFRDSEFIPTVFPSVQLQTKRGEYKIFEMVYFDLSTESVCLELHVPNLDKEHILVFGVKSKSFTAYLEHYETGFRLFSKVASRSTRYEFPPLYLSYLSPFSVGGSTRLPQLCCSDFSVHLYPFKSNPQKNVFLASEGPFRTRGANAPDQLSNSNITNSP